MRIDVDLHGPRLPELRQELRVGERRPDHQQRVALTHHLVRRSGTQQPDRARDIGQFVVQRIFTEQGFGDPGAEPVGDRLHLRTGTPGALPDQDGCLSTGVEDIGGPPQIVVVRHRRVVRHAGTGRHHLEGVLGRGVGEILDVGRDDHGGYRAAGHGGAQRPVEDVRQLLRDGDHLAVVGGDVLVEAQQIDLLLVTAAQGTAVGLPDDRDDGNVVELRVVEAVEEMDGAGSRSSHADTDLAGELGVPDGLERGHLLVPGLDETGVSSARPQAASRPLMPSPG